CYTMQCCIHKTRIPLYKHHAMLSLAASAPVLCRAVRVFVLLLCTTIDSSVEAGSPKACNRTRAVLSGSYGTFGDGPGEYPQASYCQWLIKAEEAGQFITLNFSTLATECSYDHVYVYDGDTYDSSLLGVFSGHNFPAPVTAASGRMLVMLYSDTNYALEGFEAEFHITDCPLNCSSHGVCGDNHVCQCDDLHYGLGCELPRCPDNCHAQQGHGLCFHPPILALGSSPDPFCVCEAGYFGESCSLGYSLSSSSQESQSSAGARLVARPYVDKVGDKWHWLSSESRVPGQAFTPRTSHGIAHIPELEKVYIFGGYDLNSVLGDLVVYDIKNGTWLSVGDKKSQESIELRQESRRIARLLHFASPFLNENKVFDNPTAESAHHSQFDEFLSVLPLRSGELAAQASSDVMPAQPFVSQGLHASRGFHSEPGPDQLKTWIALNS
ncbi:CUB domain, partial [Trinorchestia longiramus]